MKKRMFLMLLAVAIFVAVVGGFKFFQIKNAMAQQGSYQPPPEAVTTAIAKQETWNTSLTAIGTVAARNGVVVSADMPGIIEEISFDSGQTVQQGALLVRLDARTERAQLEAAQAQLELTRLDLQRKQGLLEKNAIPRATWERVSAENKQAEARVGEARAAVDRKIIRAPFTGVLGIRQVNVGQYVSGGSPIVPLQSLHPIYVNFTVPQQEIGRLRPGAEVAVSSDSMEGVISGKVSAIDSVIDEGTRNIQVQATFDNRAGRLRPGMFVEVEVARDVQQPVISLPISSINYAPFGDSVFIVEDVKGPDGKTYRGVRQQFVKLGGSRGDQVAVISGVKPGEEVVSSGVFKLRPGAAVIVNNQSVPGNNPAPSPEDS